MAGGRASARLPGSGDSPIVHALDAQGGALCGYLTPAVRPFPVDCAECSRLVLESTEARMRKPVDLEILFAEAYRRTRTQRAHAE